MESHRAWPSVAGFLEAHPRAAGVRPSLPLMLGDVLPLYMGNTRVSLFRHGWRLGCWHGDPLLKEGLRNSSGLREHSWAFPLTARSNARASPRGTGLPWELWREPVLTLPELTAATGEVPGRASAAHGAWQAAPTLGRSLASGAAAECGPALEGAAHPRLQGSLQVCLQWRTAWVPRLTSGGEGRA